MSTETITRWAAPAGDTVALQAEQCVFRASVAFAEKVEEGKPFGLRIRANSGEPMSHWYFGKVVVDLSGVRWNRSDIPILLDHSPARIVGYTKTLGLEEGEGLVAEGVLSKKTEEGRHVRELAEEGFPWQASVMLEIESIEDVGDDVSVEVNGYSLEGPAVVLRKTRLREVTVTTLGADENTDAELFGERRKGPIMSNVTRAAAEPKGEAPPTAAPPAEARFTQAEVDAAVSAAVAAERTRAAKIIAGAAPHQSALAASHVQKGTDAADALLSLIEGRKDANASKLDAIAASTPPPVGPDPTPFREVTASAPGAAKSSISDEEFEKRAVAAFRQDPALRNHFDEKGFVGHLETVRDGGFPLSKVIRRDLVADLLLN